MSVTSSDPTTIDWTAAPVTDVPPTVFEKPNPKAGRRAPLFGSAKKAAPSARPSKPRSTVPASKPGQFTDDIAAIYAAAAMAISIRDPICGQAVARSAVACGEQWDKLAQSNDAIRKALMALTKTSAIGAVIAAHVPIIMAVSSHHGFGPGPRSAPKDDETDD
jgi:hypothetical protein